MNCWGRRIITKNRDTRITEEGRTGYHEISQTGWNGSYHTKVQAEDANKFVRFGIYLSSHSFYRMSYREDGVFSVICVIHIATPPTDVYNVEVMAK